MNSQDVASQHKHNKSIFMAEETRVLLLSLEYAEPWIFSGNGVYCRSFVSNIFRSPESPQIKFLIVCGRPASAQPTEIKESANVQVLTVPLPIWFKLDRASSWKEFGAGITKYTKDIHKFDPQVCLGVDWTSKYAWERLCLSPNSVPFCFLCFRCFSNNNQVDGDYEFYAQREAEIMSISSCAVALSTCDAEALKRLNDTCPIQVIAPPLRDDLHAMASIPHNNNLFGLNYLTKPRFSPTPVGMTVKPRERIYITCVCRIIQSKQVMEGFVEVCESIKDFLVQNHLVPHLVGPSFEGDEGYSLQVYQRLKKAFPGKLSVIRSEFVGAAQLANIFQQTVINIHPAQQEPFGMTIIEAAAFAVPTLMHLSGVGAADLLPPSKNLSVACDFSNAKHTGVILRTLLRNQRALLQLVGNRAQQAVLRWDSQNWAKHVKRELLLPYRNRLSRRPSSLMTLPALQATWPWNTLARYVDSNDTLLVQHRVETWLARHTVDTFSQLIRRRKTKLLQPFQITAEMLQWGNHFCQQSEMLRETRFRFVPSRLPEKTFWGVFFLCLREVCSDRDDAFALLEQQAQFDDCRGIQTMARAALGDDESQLKKSAFALVRDTERVLILTGFPCCLPNGQGGSKQETDGPPGAVGLARALVALNKQVYMCIEQVSASVMEACLQEVFSPQPTQVKDTACGTKLLQFGPMVTLEIFPAEFTSELYARVDELKVEYSEKNHGHLIAIERVGPGLDGKCRTMRGRVLDDVAPLHLLFENPLARTTAIGDGGNEVGMGNVQDLHLPSKESACVTECTFLLPVSVSNWGALALCAAMSLVVWMDADYDGENDVQVLMDRIVGTDSGLQEALRACVEAGAGDGITFETNVMTVDGMPFSVTLDLTQKLRAVVVDWAL